MMKKLIVLLVFWIGLVSSAWAFDMNAQLSTPPSYQFQSTSTCSSVVGNSAFTTTTVYAPCSSSPSNAPRRSGTYNPWDEKDEEGNPSGQGVGNVYTPVGEPLILLVFAFLYLIGKRGWRRLRSRT